MPAPGLVLMGALYPRTAPDGSRRFAEAFRSRVGDEAAGVEQVVRVEGALDGLHQRERGGRPAPDGQRLLPLGRAALHDDVAILSGSGFLNVLEVPLHVGES